MKYLRYLTIASFFFLAAGIFTSVSILAVYQVLSAVPMLVFAYLAFKNKEIKLSRSSWSLIGFCVVALISCLVNFAILGEPGKSFGKIKYFLFAVLSIFYIKDFIFTASDKVKKVLFNTLLVSISIAGLYALYEKYFKEMERIKSLTDTMRYGYGSAMILLVLLSAILHYPHFKRWVSRPGLIASFILGFVGMYFTYTRGALLGFACGVPVVIWYYHRKLAIILGSLVVFGLIAVAGFYFFGNGTKESGPRILMSKSNESDQIRRSQWQAAFIAIKEKPLLGYGMGNFYSQVSRIKEENNLAHKEYIAHAHNIFLETAAGTGLIGLFLLIAWLFFWWRELVASPHVLKAVLIPFGVCLVIAGQFEVIFDANNASMIFFLYPLSQVFKK